MTSTPKALPPPSALARNTNPDTIPVTAPCELNIFMQSHVVIPVEQATEIADYIALIARTLNHNAEVVAADGRFDITSNGNRIGYIRFK